MHSVGKEDLVKASIVLEKKTWLEHTECWRRRSDESMQSVGEEDQIKLCVLIKFGSKVNIYEHVSMNGFIVQWSESVRHLGSFVDSTLYVLLDCRYKRSMFIGYVNKLTSKFCY